MVINGSKQGNGEVDVVCYSDYYPQGSPLTLATNDYRYGYQGQYVEADKGTGWNSFELRMYDPEIGRWMNVDPYAEFYSPYVGMGNNPVASVDPDGGKIDPDRPTKSDGITLKEVVITAGKGFMCGANSTWDFMKSQWTWKGYGEGLANTFTFGMYGSVQTLQGSIIWVKYSNLYNKRLYLWRIFCG